MFDLDKWGEIWASITANKTRSILTAFGVFWGIFMLVLLIGAGYSFKHGILSQIEGFASNACFVQARKTSEAYKGYRKGRFWNMKNSDIALIREKAQTVEYIAPVLFSGGGDKNIIYKQKSGSYGVRGVYPDHFNVEAQIMLEGRQINDIDMEQKRKVCMIGEQVSKTLFDKASPIGEYVKVNGIYFQVIGVMKPVSNASIGGPSNEAVFIPFITLQQAFNMGDRVHFLACTAKKGIPVEQVEIELSTILKSANNISPTDKSAVRTFNIEKEFKLFNNLFLGIDALIWIIGIGTLMTGVIGISNIMMVTVRERTREIGVRRAIGAKPFSILSQIMLESLVLTAIAGLGGLILGIGILEAVSYIMRGGDSFLKPPTVSFNVAIVALIILIVSGLLAGLIPALRALQIKAIDAIRDE